MKDSREEKISSVFHGCKFGKLKNMTLTHDCFCLKTHSHSTSAQRSIIESYYSHSHNILCPNTANHQASESLTTLFILFIAYYKNNIVKYKCGQQFLFDFGFFCFYYMSVCICVYEHMQVAIKTVKTWKAHTQRYLEQMFQYSVKRQFSELSREEEAWS